MFCALTMASASVAVDRAELQRAAELAAEERERYAMHAAGLESHMAQRMFLEDVMLPQPWPPITYARGYMLRHNALIESHESMRTVLRLLRRGRVSRAMQVADDELGGVASDESGASEGSEEESLDDDEPVQAAVQAPVQGMSIEDLQQVLLAQITQQAPAVQPFSGRNFRLDD